MNLQVGFIATTILLGTFLVLRVRKRIRATETFRRATAAAPRHVERAVPSQLISVIMPALNEEENIVGAIRNVLAAFDSFGIAGEIVAINDGSMDRTPELIREEIKRDSRVRLINHEKPGGIGAAFWDGVS